MFGLEAIVSTLQPEPNSELMEGVLELVADASCGIAVTPPTMTPAMAIERRTVPRTMIDNLHLCGKCSAGLRWHPGVAFEEAGEGVDGGDAVLACGGQVAA